MFDAPKLARETQRTFERLLPRLEQEFAGAMPHADWDAILKRPLVHFPTLF